MSCMKWVSVVVAAVVAGSAVAADVPAHEAAALEALKGVATYAHQARSADVPDDIYLGFDADGKAVCGVAIRKVKTYKAVTVLVQVRRVEGKLVVEKVTVPDVAAIKEEKKQKKITDAVASTTGKTVKEADGTVVNIDAVTGATKYEKAAYDAFDAMSKALVQCLDTPPAWDRKPLPTAP